VVVLLLKILSIIAKCKNPKEKYVQLEPIKDILEQTVARFVVGGPYNGMTPSILQMFYKPMKQFFALVNFIDC
jgi:hypothetical protein